MDSQDPQGGRSGAVEFLARAAHLPIAWVRIAVNGACERWNQADAARRGGFRAAVVVVAALAGLVWWQEMRIPRVAARDLLRLVEQHCWITYDPTQLDPRVTAEISTPSVRADLRRIRAAGFTGVVTFSSRGGFARIPRLAREARLAVIMGVWDPGDAGELGNAIAARDFVDGYCIGHDGLDKPDGYDLEELTAAIALVKRRTGLPVTTSDEVRLYESPAADLAALGDWLFPDIHVSLLPLAGAPVDRTHEIAALAARTRRPLMLNMVSFPWQGIAGASLASQSAGFARFLDALRSPEEGLAVRPGVVIHGAFDLPWKDSDPPFNAWDPWTGVLEADGTARSAARAIAVRCR